MGLHGEVWLQCDACGKCSDKVHYSPISEICLMYPLGMGNKPPTTWGMESWVNGKMYPFFYYCSKECKDTYIARLLKDES